MIHKQEMKKPALCRLLCKKLIVQEEILQVFLVLSRSSNLVKSIKTLRYSHVVN